MDKQSPFIIWTFRRSGGTNLGQALFTNSQYDGVEHEPFNQDRLFGYIVKKWREEHDIKYLYQEIEKILQTKPLIKHCLELMPNELNLAIAELSIKYGYKHLFLYREAPTSRLLSLNYAMKTNVWGKKHIKTRPFDEAVFDELIPITQLLHHESECRSKMRQIYDFFKQRELAILSVSFEMLYESDFNYACMLVNRLFEELIGHSDSVTTTFLAKTLKSGGQGTNAKYTQFPNSEQFIYELKKLPLFRLYDELEIDSSIDAKILVTYCKFFKALPSVAADEFILHGVVLCESSFTIFDLISGSNLNVKKILDQKELLKCIP